MDELGYILLGVGGVWLLCGEPTNRDLLIGGFLCLLGATLIAVDRLTQRRP